ncbi:MAG: hypothetical protein WD096_08170 [Actinomycetota bacterium]
MRSELPSAADPTVMGPLPSVDLAVSPDGDFVGYTVERGPGLGELWLFEVDSGRSSQLVAGLGTLTDPAWSEGGDRIAFVVHDAQEASLMSVPSRGGEVEVLQTLPEQVSALDMTSDWALAAFVPSGRQDMYIMDVAGGEVSRAWENPTGSPVRPAWSPSGEELAMSVRGQILLVSPATPDDVRRVPTTAEVFEIDWVADGVIVFSGRSVQGEGDLDIFAVDVTTGSLRALPSTLKDDRSPSFLTSG